MGASCQRRKQMTWQFDWMESHGSRWLDKINVILIFEFKLTWFHGTITNQILLCHWQPMKFLSCHIVLILTYIYTYVRVHTHNGGRSGNILFVVKAALTSIMRRMNANQGIFLFIEMENNLLTHYKFWRLSDFSSLGGVILLSLHILMCYLEIINNIYIVKHFYLLESS